MNRIAVYPQTTELTLELRPLLHPRMQELNTGISEFTFANLFLFRRRHNYTLTTLADQTLAVLGRDGSSPFFMLPFGLPDRSLLDLLFSEHHTLKCATRAQAELLSANGCRIIEDRDNFDYLYRRQDLAQLPGRNYHKKRNLIKAFLNSHSHSAQPLREEFRTDALRVLEDWRAGTDGEGDYPAAREALQMMEELQLCGGIYYVGSRPAAYVLGEEMAGFSSFLIHFEKAVPGYKGLYQYINKSFAAILPESYQTINREQDLGDEGLRQAKLSYHPMGFVEKFKVTAPLPSTPES